MPVSLLLTTFVVSEGGVPKEMKVEHAAQGADRRVARSGDPRIAFAIDHFVMAVTSSGWGLEVCATYGGNAVLHPTEAFLGRTAAGGCGARRRDLPRPSKGYLVGRRHGRCPAQRRCATAK